MLQSVSNPLLRQTSLYLKLLSQISLMQMHRFMGVHLLATKIPGIQEEMHPRT